jgi:hypothetical protein
MPRRPGQAKPDVPFWRRDGQPQILSKRDKQRLIREVATAAVVVHGTVVTPGGKALHDAQASTQAFRNRKQIVPFAWLAGILLAGLGAHKAHLIVPGLLLAAAAPVVMVLLTRHMGFAAKAVRWMALITLIFVTILTLAGPGKYSLGALFLAWLCVLVPWLRNYRIRPEIPQPEPVEDHVRWNMLAGEKKWNAALGPAEELPGDGRRYRIQADGIKTTIGNILAASENVAGAWHKPMTEAYAERSPDGITSRGYLTVLGRDTLMRVREWNGAGIDPVTGTAIVGRYADGAPVHMKFFTPRYGTRHALISGTSGSGKSELLNLILFVAVECGFIVPVVLDPQEGQSLPFWRDRCLYAAGPAECEAMLRGLHAGMLDRSRYLSGLRWDDDGVAMRGMGFFDHALTGLPVVLIIFDEAHMLLPASAKAKEDREIVQKTTEIGRLGRKTGTALWLGTHLPSLSELGGSQALRDMLRGGNVVSLRTANKVAAGMLGLEKDPSQIQPYFTDGKETTGLGYTAGPDNRPDAPMRTDLVPKAVKRGDPAVRPLDDRFAEAMDRAMSLGGVQLDLPRPPVPASPLAAVPDGPPGRTCTDALLAVLDREMGREEIIRRMQAKAREWGRPQPFSISAVRDALRDLPKTGRITKVRHGSYAPIRPVLHAVSGSASTSQPHTGGSGS